MKCPNCARRTLMVKVRARYVQQSGAHEEWDAWYCTGCGKAYKKKDGMVETAGVMWGDE